MIPAARWLRGLVSAPAMPDACRHTYRRHMAYSLLDAATKGILANAPVMAIKGMGSPDWQMSLQLSISSIGMFVVLYLGGRMASAHKKPYVLVPGFGYASTAFAMACTSDVLLFLIIFGLGALFDVLTRPALTAIIRLNYPATHRGAVTGEIRRWFSLVFLGAGLLAAWLLDLVAENPGMMINSLMIVAGVLSLASLLVFKTIKVQETQEKLSQQPRHSPWQHFAEALSILKRNRRFRRYLVWAFVYAFGGLLYVSFIPVFLVKELDYGYTASSLFTHIIPSLVAFAMTGIIGRWIDTVSTWKAWAVIRLGWGLDPLILAATPIVMLVFPPAAVLLPLFGRLIRGSVMGGSWILWWQIAVNHFAPPGGDTTRYMGIIFFMNGTARLLAPLAGAALLQIGSVQLLFVIGGVMILTTSVVSLLEYEREKRDEHLSTMADFEDSFNSAAQ